MRRTVLFLAALCILAVSVASAAPLPPVLVQKEATRWPESPSGFAVVLDADTETAFELSVPDPVVFDADGATTLTLHFHGASWFMRQEHARRGASHPLLVANAKSGDAAFETDIMKPGVLEGLLAQVAAELQKNGGPPNARVGSLELSGFSAGYAGVRGVLRMPEFEPRVARVLLGDSLYVGDGPESNAPDRRAPRPGPDGIGPFIDYARKAAAGERTLLMEFSTTPSMRSVGPMDCARAVIAALDVPVLDVPANSVPASRTTADYRLAWRADSGNAHFWCYDSPDGRPIHLAHVRNQADMWRALDGLTTADAQPPAMPVRPIAPTDPLPGESVPLDIGTEGTVTLFIPAGYKVPANGQVVLTVHFHAATWFVIQEHLRRGMGDPLVALELGQGSSVYRVPFEDPERFRLLLETVAEELKSRDAPPETRIATVDMTSFSAGYGAVREIVRTPEYVDLLRRVVLGDSSYGSLDETALADGRRIVDPAHVEPWADFGRIAMSGKKTLLMLTSDIAPETYAGTHEVARAVAESLGVETVAVAPGTTPASAPGLDYPLHTRADSGSFHWWAYGGTDAVVHMTLARHIAEAWNALDQCGDP